LYQEVLYHRLTARRQQRLHQQIGEREEKGYGEKAREIAAELALHFERGRDYRKAVRYLQQAGENAVRRSANQEAASLLTRGLELLKTLPDTPERTKQELRLQLALSSALLVTKGYAAPEVGEMYTRARELCQQVGDDSQLFSVLTGLNVFYFTRAELHRAREQGEQSLALAQRMQNATARMRAHNMLGITLRYLGEHTLSREQYEQGIALYECQENQSGYHAGATDPGVTNFVGLAVALWYLGYPAQALQRSDKALTIAQESAHAFSLTWALCHAAMLHLLRREAQAAQEQAEATIARCHEQGSPLYLTMATVIQGWALAEQGQRKEGIRLMRQGLAGWRATGAEIAQSIWLALLAEAYGKEGQIEEGLTVLAEALAIVNKTGERVYEAELYRLKGQLTLQQFQVSGSKFQVSENQKAKGKKTRRRLASSVQSLESEAEECFHRAIEIARKQQAKSLELRAVMSLSGLWQQQGKRKEAHEMLAEVYGWFTEGFDTKDLQEAKVLLEELDR
jgi:predicted ATPase